ncbi:CoA-binding protein [Anditalea andensis]|uniref:CoA-binding protein n=1 Tax=Anditalea andensis TaxID=1048983 RepID=A0A074L1T0_9BACT|nr:CoA-binding protein [Anditalea andensis]KEO73828.1 CoA-binding protein [Anditalea andensis]
MESKKTVVLGASTNPTRYAFIAANMLKDYHHEVVPVGIKKGEIAGQAILNLKEKPEIDDIDTITLYLGPQNQPEWYPYILSLKPKRIIFNPGTENRELMDMARKQGIEVEIGCTLVMLRSGQY